MNNQVALFSVLVTSALSFSSIASNLEVGESELAKNEYIVVLNDSVVSASDVAEKLSSLSQGDVSNIYEEVIKGFSIEIEESNLGKILSSEHVAYVHANTKVSNSSFEQHLSPPLKPFYRNLDIESGSNLYFVGAGFDSFSDELIGRVGKRVNFAPSDSAFCLGKDTRLVESLVGKEVGLASNATLHDVSWLGCNNSGNLDDALAALEWVAQNHTKPALVNFSSEFSNVLIDRAMKSLSDEGVAVSYGQRSSGDIMNFFKELSHHGIEASKKEELLDYTIASVPSAPSSIIVSPNYSTGASTVDWLSVSGAVEYEVWGDRDPSFSRAFKMVTTPSTSFTFNPSGVNIYVRVKACNSSGCSPYSSQVVVRPL